MKMKRINKTLIRSLALILAVMTMALLVSCGDNKQKAGTNAGNAQNGADDASANRFTLELEGDPWDIYAPYEEVSWGYRYGPSIMVSEDGRIDAWYSSLGAFKQADFILHNSSTDGGLTWSDEDCPLMPTADSWDSFSCCDPAAVYFNGYYYIAYTSTTDTKGYCNSAFVARSKTIDGEYEKWNGSGWGGYDPRPFIRWDGIQQCWGIGEISFVVLDGQLYIYYTLRDMERNYACLATADTSDGNWPGALTYHGKALEMDNDESGVEFRYVDKFNTFIALSVASVRTEESYLIVYTSKDGKSYLPSQRLRRGMHSFAHNPGLSGDAQGHITDPENVYLGYAYGEEWGAWATAFQKVKILFGPDADFSDINNDEVSKRHYFKRTPTPHDFVPVTITTKPHKYVSRVADGAFEIEVYELNSMYKSRLTEEPVSCADYDTNVVSIEGTTVTPVAPGETYVRIECGGKYCVAKIVICSDETDLTSRHVLSFGTYYDEMTVDMDSVIATQIRGVVHCEDTEWGEASNIDDDTASFKMSEFEIEYVSSDESVLLVTESGLITPFKKGTATVTLRLNGKYTTSVNVTVN